MSSVIVNTEPVPAQPKEVNTVAAGPTISVPSVGALISAIVAFVSNRTVHKLGATALAAGGLVVGDKFTTVVGAAYAAVMHATGGLKKIAD
jgi:hypothetical protein